MGIAQVSMHRRRSFILLEVMIAFAIVSLCAVPLMRQPILYYRAEIASLKQSELQRLADLAFAEVKESLFQQSVPWHKLPSKTTPGLIIPLADATLRLQLGPDETIARSCILKCQGEKRGKQGAIVRIYRAQIKLNRKDSFWYYLVLQGVPESP